MSHQVESIKSTILFGFVDGPMELQDRKLEFHHQKLGFWVSPLKVIHIYIYIHIYSSPFHAELDMFESCSFASTRFWMMAGWNRPTLRHWLFSLVNDLGDPGIPSRRHGLKNTSRHYRMGPPR